jgi:dTDP-4-amino-4,6-dideoxygalactose transaminase
VPSWQDTADTKLSQTSNYIEAFPQFQLRDCLRKDQGTLSGFSGLYSSGRAAIYWALKRLRLPSGAAVWIPAFHCGVEVDAAIAAGARVHFYRITEQLSIDFEELRCGLQLERGPVLAIHYFGFPQPDMERLVFVCREAGVPLIEDCAHSLFSCRATTPLGSFGVLSVFSFPKSLSVVEGGALRDNSKADAPEEDLRPSITPYKVYAKTWVRLLAPDLLVRWYRGRSQPEADYLEDFAISEFPFYYYDQPSLLTTRIVATQLASQIVRRRRANWNLLHTQLSQSEYYSPVFSCLPEGVCPLVLPIWVSGRRELEDSLKQRGIGSFVFGRLPHRLLSVFQRAKCRKLRDHILGLPIHQQLDPMDIHRIAGEAVSLLSKYAFSTFSGVTASEAGNPN